MIPAKLSNALAPVLLLAAFALAQPGGCGTTTPPVCTACTYKRATFEITDEQLQGGTIKSAVMHTEMTHPKCPYGGSSPCTATLDIDVKCKTSGAGTVIIDRRPNGYSKNSVNVSAVTLVVELPTGGTTTVPVTVTMGPPQATAAESPCGGSIDPVVTH